MTIPMLQVKINSVALKFSDVDGWIKDILKLEVETWTLLSEEMNKIISIFNNYNELIVNTLEDIYSNDEVTVLGSDWVNKMDALIAVAVAMKNLGEYAAERIQEEKDLDYNAFMSVMDLQDNMFANCRKDFKVFLKKSYKFITNILKLYHRRS
ncbi:PREDICTED: uncharacterized protein LOC108557016 isoform X2 [Nicrophorus vespilloides]|uniref:Uncharacterized protein LOC108557016 isoform X2 n=1 Tax=Nicrophorus vespilloides TaxID=110193 RepID=A0ABM1M2T2_NICVS|nr:PREDICTED: uncharacterized protein LOC108557016 isoform X2 [Nicrophorus vespilloides]